MKVLIYTTPLCAFCKTEKQWLDSLGIAYDTVDINEDEKAMEFMRTLEHTGVPVTVIENGDDKQVIHGFDRPRLSLALGLDK